MYVSRILTLFKMSYVKVIKTAHRKSHFSKTLVSQEIFAGLGCIGLRKSLF